MKKGRAKKVTENGQDASGMSLNNMISLFLNNLDPFQTEEYKSAKSLLTSVWYHKGIIN